MIPGLPGVVWSHLMLLRRKKLERKVEGIWTEARGQEEGSRPWNVVLRRVLA